MIVDTRCIGCGGSAPGNDLCQRCLNEERSGVPDRTGGCGIQGCTFAGASVFIIECTDCGKDVCRDHAYYFGDSDWKCDPCFSEGVLESILTGRIERKLAKAATPRKPHGTPPRWVR